MELYPKFACKRFNDILPVIARELGYTHDHIPQLQDVSEFLQSRSGFIVRPVAGYMSSRDFLNGLAFRVFHATQYIRYHGYPYFSEEPDVAHELMGHVPMFSDPEFADFSQQIGIASLGATDEHIVKLSTLYFHTIECGLCIENGEKRVYGAAVLSSSNEIAYAMSSKPKVLRFDAHEASQRNFLPNVLQPVYYLADSFECAKTQVSAFVASLNKLFVVKIDSTMDATVEHDKTIDLQYIHQT
jgi:phenylalanine-4-hydroxylase